ncbi:Hypothetical protein A7982_10486 [Minicystis rosea]|nr:Hypothetical protein A7982_10486 [Minicystis rosea]
MAAFEGAKACLCQQDTCLNDCGTSLCGTGQPDGFCVSCLGAKLDPQIGACGDIGPGCSAGGSNDCEPFWQCQGACPN